jgi:Tol biopolymer transport system component/predicted Ser/Thr protein kinase
VDRVVAAAERDHRLEAAIAMIAAGTRLGPYEIVSPIGAGGMGEVWKARDTRLDRSVAIKILPAEFAENAQLRVRFEREAKTISQLNHPHICTLYDVGENYLVMELLDGESLADRIARGPLPLDQVIRYGVEIAEALEKAHRAGVVHRDLKPGNVMLTKSGAKLLDFGLAKSSVFDMTVDGATMQKTLTAEGTIVGTFQYMSPEQLEGIEVDQRTDIFALGAVLYEMATGRRAFDGKTRTSLIAAIVAADPKPMSELQPLTPVALEQVVRACLAKDADERIQTGHDVALQLRWIGTSSSAVAASSERVRARRRTAVLWPVAVVAVAIASWFAAARWQKAHTASPVYRMTISTPEGWPLGYSSGAMALSRDGRMLAYAGAGPTGENLLLVRKLSETTFRVLDGTAGARLPFWSPDGKSIGYCTRERVCKVAADGSSAPEELAKFPLNVGSATWGNGVVLVVCARKLYRINASGGEPAEVPTAGLAGVTLPRFLPDQRHLLVRTPDERICVIDIEGRDAPKPLLPHVYAAAYANGHLFFYRGGMLYAQPFNPRTLSVSGEPAAIAKVQIYGQGSAMFAVSDDALVYLPSGSEVHTALQRIDRKGDVMQTIAAPAYYFSPRVSRDGTRVAVDLSVSDGPGDIWIFDTRDSRGTRFTFSPDNESAPLWSPDDREIAYFVDKRPVGVGTARKRVAGGEPQPAAVSTDFNTYTGDWSPDNRWFVTTSSRVLGSFNEIVTYALPSWSPAPGVARFPGRAPRFSPDSKWLAWESNERGQYDVFVQPFPPNGSKWQISVDGGEKPVWSRDGKSIFFVTTSGRLAEVAVTTAADGSLTAQAPQQLFAVRMRELAQWAQYDVFPDGTFLVNRVPDNATTPMTAVINWRSTLER